MENNYFKIKYAGKEINLIIDSSELKLCQADEFENKLSLFIDIQAKSIEVDFFDEEEQETYQHYIKPRIHTEWLEIPTELIKNKNFRSLETVNIDFKDSQEMDEIAGLIWTESPGALYIDNHGVFEDVKIDFKYLEQGVFQVKLAGIAEPGTPFEVSAEVRLLIELKAYDNRSTKDDILNFFEKTFLSEEFNQEWRYREEDIFFTATPKN